MTQPPELARPLSAWTEADGDVLWWKFPINEAPYIGTPNDCGHELLVIVNNIQQSIFVGGWPGYHTHWTPLPPFPLIPEETEK